MKIEIELFNNNHPVHMDNTTAMSTTINIVGFAKLTANEQKVFQRDFNDLLKRLE